MRRRMAPLRPEAHERALDALALTRREGMSLTAAARMVRTDPRTVRRHVGQAFRRHGHRWRPRPFDRIPRGMTVMTPEGPTLVVIRDSRSASLVAQHANAVQHYLLTGDDSRLRKLRRKRLQVDGELLALVVSPNRIDRLADGAEIHFELYRR